MALDPEELVTLTNHGTMKLRSAVARAMMLLPRERDLATIIRESEPTILNFELIKHLAARWEKQECPCRQNGSNWLRPTQRRLANILG